MSEGKKTVFVGLSGGVDSSIAALRLLKNGYRVVGVFIKVWQPDFLNCNWEAERLDAMRVCATLGIPFLTCDATERYKNDVADYLIREYQKGRTPNPDVMCNKHIKFGSFFEFAKTHGADYIATGHYAQVRHTEKESIFLRSVDASKDQSYFLWAIPKDILKTTLFPIGDTTKSNIRKEAERAGLLTAKKADSQGVCFLGALDMKEFLYHFLPREPGVVVNEEGEVVGNHDGVNFYTVGQRHGFDVTKTNSSEKPYYIVKKDSEQNTLTVSHHKPLSPISETFTLSDTNWLTDIFPEQVQIETRYRQKPTTAQLETKGNILHVRPLEPFDTPAIGQSCVVYDGTQCLGGGIVDTHDTLTS